VSAENASPVVSTSGSEQRLAVVTALAANVAIAVAKFGAAAITGSSAMLAEALHSLADSVNEVLLLVGARRSRQPADARHPFGYTRYRYLYAFLVSLTVFWVGGVLAVYEGVTNLGTTEPLVDPVWAFVVLGIGAVLEGLSLRTTVRTGRSTKGSLTWKRFLEVSKAPEIIVIFLEDLGALIGIGIAVAGVGLTMLTGESTWDAIASICIGILLMAIGVRVNRETQSLLVGEAATAEVEAAIREAIAGTPGIAGVMELRTIHVGPDDLVVAAGISVDASQDATDITASIARAEERVRRIAPFRTLIYLEPRLAQSTTDDPPRRTERPDEHWGAPGSFT
jgi:cation diffusion facilitator family transporter